MIKKHFIYQSILLFHQKSQLSSIFIYQSIPRVFENYVRFTLLNIEKGFVIYSEILILLFYFSIIISFHI